MSEGLEVLTTGKKRTKIVATLDNGNALLSKQEIEVIEKELKEHEKIKKVLENIQTSKNKVKVPLSAIFEGLSQEEKYTLIEHIYYSQAPWEEKYRELEEEYKKITKANSDLIEQNYELNTKIGEVRDDYTDLKNLYDNQTHNIEMLMKENKIQKQVLEVLKKKKIDIDFFLCCIHYFNDKNALEQYNSFSDKEVTEEDFNLLKGWLKHQ